jgi:RNA polymerase sigma-70 factor (ECF subfamily)
MNTLETDFAQMVREHKSTIYTVCFMFSKDQEDVDDLFQEVLINLWKGFKSFQGKSKASTWIWKVSFNTCLSLERRKKTKNRSKKRAARVAKFRKAARRFDI